MNHLTFKKAALKWWDLNKGSIDLEGIPNMKYLLQFHISYWEAEGFDESTSTLAQILFDGLRGNKKLSWKEIYENTMWILECADQTLSLEDHFDMMVKWFTGEIMG